MSDAKTSTVEVVKNFVGGEWVASTSGEAQDVYNPSSGEVIARVPLSTRAELDAAVANSAEAFETWSRTSVVKRAQFLFRFEQLLERHRDELADIITLENGKNHKEALGEVGRGLENVMHAASIPNLLMGDALSTIATDVEVANYRYPIGVTGGICPFNFPFMVPFWMFPMSIACGNTMVIKPSEKTPLTTARVAELVAEAGLPAGVLNVVQGARDVVGGLVENPTVKSISFVGSEPVGRYVYKAGTGHYKRVQALTGAKNHSVVLADADLDDAVRKIIGGGFGSSGERCMAGPVVVVEDAIADAFVDKFVAQTKKTVTYGDTTKGDYFMGPMIRKEAQQRTFGYIQAGIEEGATLLLDGRKNLPDRGYFVGPTIFDNVEVGMKIWTDEIFAPVVGIMRVKDLSEAVAVIDRHHLANGACIFTNSADAIRYFRENVDAGSIGVNLGVPAALAYYPFSGWKDSFFGSLHVNGKDAVEFYTHRKIVTAQFRQARFH